MKEAILSIEHKLALRLLLVPDLFYCDSLEYPSTASEFNYSAADGMINDTILEFKFFPDIFMLQTNHFLSELYSDGKRGLPSHQEYSTWRKLPLHTKWNDYQLLPGVVERESLLYRYDHLFG